MENQKKTGRGKVVIAVVALIVVVAVLAAVYYVFGPKASGGEKTITVDVVLLDGSDTETTITVVVLLQGRRVPGDRRGQYPHRGR